MARSARRKSASGIYHIMLRGANGQQIFLDKQDNERFLQTLLRYKDVCGYQIYAYCLMGNHVHLLLKETEEPLAQILKRIAGSYVYWYNLKYQRQGHLFQDRFRSEPVNDDAYFLTALRYIHQNPVKAHLCKSPQEYAYSSYQAYLQEQPLVDTALLFSMITPEQYLEEHRKEFDDTCLDITAAGSRMIDEDVVSLICKIAQSNQLEDVKTLGKEQKKQLLHQLKESGASVRQIHRLTGIAKGMIEKA